MNTPSSNLNPPTPQVQRARSHGRAASGDERRRVAIPRRSTKGPLQDSDVIDDPLSAQFDTNPNRILSPTRSVPSPLSPPHDGQQQQLPDMPQKDLSFIQDASAYHVLPASNIPPPFLNAPSVPPVSSPIDTLLASGHYRLAAIAAARNIVTAASPTDYETLFHLLHIRLACLCLIHEHSLAAQESKVLGDLNSSFYLHPLTNAHIVPWDLRLLVVRLAALGYGEWRKGIMGYYELARECRDNIAKSDLEDDKRRWRNRLRDCGIRVANVLVEMGDLEGAGRHLSSLSPASTDTMPSTSEGDEKEEDDDDDAKAIVYMETLVWLRVGDIRAARLCLSRASGSTTPNDTILNGALTALSHLADSSYARAVSTLQALHEQHPSNPMITQNLAVCLLYTGHIAQARSLLSSLAIPASPSNSTDEATKSATPPFHSLTFNLCTIYELCTERSRDRKVRLAEALAERTPDGVVGWEIPSADFKL
ncbi:hypothetical protein BU24DRAFT_383593 [Aaosphaeria arxii CBS 175.79]|uniref:TPR-like protein n=1 Tax=Aaosphaeria arxii CBS 175.79 TaxID=1450172 RepID=A0A6A5Y7J0_9PLEO|nr:uncharacterized protein BU24DRAFT_383593 [Aaosphaeria arxii CBS 175.79]KAF2021535.1 hypothetical protein BU24DRAFT_383593 [Aaosphaeria arxii CBS 175.79]